LELLKKFYVSKIDLTESPEIKEMYDNGDGDGQQPPEQVWMNKTQILSEKGKDMPFDIYNSVGLR
jgi:hypothetical protein